MQSMYIITKVVSFVIAHRTACLIQLYVINMAIFFTTESSINKIGNIEWSVYGV